MSYILRIYLTSRDSRIPQPYSQPFYVAVLSFATLLYDSETKLVRGFQTGRALPRVHHGQIHPDKVLVRKLSLIPRVDTPWKLFWKNRLIYLYNNII